jgi:hypothetical protein
MGLESFHLSPTLKNPEKFNPLLNLLCTQEKPRFCPKKFSGQFQTGKSVLESPNNPAILCVETNYLPNAAYQ